MRVSCEASSTIRGHFLLSLAGLDGQASKEEVLAFLQQHAGGSPDALLMPPMPFERRDAPGLARKQLHALGEGLLAFRPDSRPDPDSPPDAADAADGPAAPGRTALARFARAADARLACAQLHGAHSSELECSFLELRRVACAEWRLPARAYAAVAPRVHGALGALLREVAAGAADAPPLRLTAWPVADVEEGGGGGAPGGAAGGAGAGAKGAHGGDAHEPALCVTLRAHSAVLLARARSLVEPLLLGVRLTAGDEEDAADEDAAGAGLGSDVAQGAVANGGGGARAGEADARRRRALWHHLFAQLDGERLLALLAAADGGAEAADGCAYVRADLRRQELRAWPPTDAALRRAEATARALHGALLRPHLELALSRSELAALMDARTAAGPGAAIAELSDACGAGAAFLRLKPPALLAAAAVGRDQVPAEQMAELARAHLGRLVAARRGGEGCEGAPLPEAACALCGCSAVGGRAAAVLGCGHRYCAGCCAFWVDSAAAATDARPAADVPAAGSAAEADERGAGALELCCAADGCTQRASVSDFKGGGGGGQGKGAPKPSPQLLRALRAALAAHVRAAAASAERALRFCPGPACACVLVAPCGARTARCPCCASVACVRCGTAEHEGLSCAQALHIAADEGGLGAAGRARIGEAVVASLAVACPRCTHPLCDFDGCAVLACAECGCCCCGWCNAECAEDTAAAHAHVAACAAKPEGACGCLCSRAQLDAAQRSRHAGELRRLAGALPATEVPETVAWLEKQVSNLELGQPASDCVSQPQVSQPI